MTTTTDKPHSQRPPQAFTLIGDDGTMGPSELAAAIERKTGHRPTTQTIRNHASKGTISGQKHPKIGWRFTDLAIEQWVRNRPTPKHGGRRKNAGKRKTDGLPSSTLTGIATRARDARQEIRAQLTPDDDGVLPEVPANAMRLIDVLRCTQEQVEAIVSIRTPVELMDSVQIARLDEINKLQHSSLKLAKEKGELVEARTVSAAWLEEQTRIANLVLNMPKAVSGRLAAACWISDEHRHRICSMIKEAGVDKDIITALSHELARPPEMVGRIRAMLDDALRKVMAEVAGADDAGAG